MHRNSIQEILEDAFRKITGENLKLTAAGRTDAGVHAFNQTAHFESDKIFEPHSLIYSLNSVLPESITVKSISKAKIDFHSRYSAKRREYLYQISTANRSIYRQYYHRLHYKLDFNLIDNFIKIITGYHSFRSLCKNNSDKHNFYCRLFEIKYKISSAEKSIIFKISADRFLHSMVRAIIGTIVDIGRGRLDLKETADKFKKGEKIKTTYLPANALFLNKIYYK